MNTRGGIKRKTEEGQTTSKSSRQKLDFGDASSGAHSSSEQNNSEEMIEHLSEDEESQFDANEARFIAENSLPNTNQNAHSSGKLKERTDSQTRPKQVAKRKTPNKKLGREPTVNREEIEDQEVTIRTGESASKRSTASSENEIDRLNQIVGQSSLSVTEISKLSDLFKNKDSLDKILLLADRLNNAEQMPQAARGFQEAGVSVQNTRDVRLTVNTGNLANMQGNVQVEGEKVKQMNPGVDKAIQSPSESTIYSRMCPSLSNENFADQEGLIKLNQQIEPLEMEMGNKTEQELTPIEINSIDAFISDIRQNMPSTSSEKTQEQLEQERQLLAERESKERADKILLEAELNRAELLKPGKEPINNLNQQEIIADKLGQLLGVNLKHLVYDARHKSLGSHVDLAMRNRILRGEFVELDKLLPHQGKRGSQSRSRMQLCNQDGRAFWMAEVDDSVINSYRKWEQAFEIYASIYITAFPNRAGELYDYKHVIRDAADNFVWENVAGYDDEFRRHLGTHPTRGWTPKLADEWSKHMKTQIHRGPDKAVLPGGAGQGRTIQNANNNNNPGNKSREICRRYNKGRCTFGQACKFLHKCAKCFKFGHGASICRRKDPNQKEVKIKEESKAGRELN